MRTAIPFDSIKFFSLNASLENPLCYCQSPHALAHCRNCDFPLQVSTTERELSEELLRTGESAIVAQTRDYFDSSKADARRDQVEPIEPLVRTETTGDVLENRPKNQSAIVQRSRSVSQAA